MKTKTLFLAGLLFAVGAASSSAQTPVYSVNAVGYVSVTVPAGGFKMVCNPLNFVTNGIQTNSLDNILPNAPVNSTKVFRFNPADQSYTTFQKRPAGWLLSSGTLPNSIINPGEGFFVQNTSVADITLTFVGEVPQGTNLTINIVSGFNMVAPHVPIGGLVTTELGLPAVNGETVYTFNGAYSTFTKRPGTSWLPNEPTVGVGEGFFYKTTLGPKSWTRSFSTSL